MKLSSFVRSFVPLCVLSLTSAVLAQRAPELEITVEAGEHDRVNVPIRVRTGIKRSEINSIFGIVSLAGENRKDSELGHFAKPGLHNAGVPDDEIVLHFILPSLKAGTKKVFKYPGPMFGIGGGLLRWSKHDGEASLNVRPYRVSYIHPTLDESTPASREQTYKPFHHLYVASDHSSPIRLVTKGPGGRYTHHRGLYFGFNKVTYGDGLTCDTWHCKPGAYQAHEKFLAEETESLTLGRQCVQIGWHGVKGERFAEEQREVTAYWVTNVPRFFIDFSSIVRTADGKPIKLDGDPQHAGFHFRADNEVAEKTLKQTYYLRPDGKGKPGETRNWDAKNHDPKAVNEPWKVMSFVLGGTRYSALYLDHPNNPKEARSSERDYGRFGTYFEYEITADKPLKVNYRLILKEGEFTQEEAARLSADFTDPPKVTVKKL